MVKIVSKTLTTIILVSFLSAVLWACAHIPHTKKKALDQLSRYAPTPILRPNQFFKDRSGSVFKLTEKMGEIGGTAFSVISSNNHVYLLTNEHVCELAVNGEMWARRDSGESFKVNVVAYSHTDDLCALTPVPGSPPLKLANSWYLSQYVMLFGHPKLRPLAASAGILVRQGIGGTTEDVKPGEPCGRFEERVKTFILFSGTKETCVRSSLPTVFSTAPALHGSSGSPALDMDGNVVGVVYAIDPKTLESSLVPLKSVKGFLDSLP